MQAVLEIFNTKLFFSILPNVMDNTETRSFIRLGLQPFIVSDRGFTKLGFKHGETLCRNSNRVCVIVLRLYVLWGKSKEMINETHEIATNDVLDQGEIEDLEKQHQLVELKHVSADPFLKK